MLLYTSCAEKPIETHDFSNFILRQSCIAKQMILVRQVTGFFVPILELSAQGIIVLNAGAQFLLIGHVLTVIIMQQLQAIPGI